MKFNLNTKPSFLMNNLQFVNIVSATLLHVRREFPHSQNRVFESAEDLQKPSIVHPIFYGSFDWHSCVHSHWLLLRALERAPQGPQARQIEQHFNSHFTGPKVEAEHDFFRRPAQAGFERPYGWVWLLKLVAQLKVSTWPQASQWLANLEPLAELIASRLKSYLPKLVYPIRSGQHNNTAFALLLALDYAQAFNQIEFEQLLRALALSYFQDAVACPDLEPGGEDFLSPTWQQALLMQRVLAPEEYRQWFSKYLPAPSFSTTSRLFIPVQVSDRTDGRLAHLDGLNLSRAWCMTRISRSFAVDSDEHRRLTESAALHLQASSDHLHDHYMGEHWLATFLFLALDA
ncbi:DUF2891 domain-containing protein [Pseudomonas fluorescens]|uniref:DUF2891 domain-containing protein n=1 Tax=Pseudomonas fluorescens TaxID=294 RepID=UPI000CA33CC7|nr:DUF2891 domain-containing protein [Pseudomonas fluorescens]AUM70795.1 DUF2891 domain-containing protein [Pseudomonas fluorescens]